MRATTLEAAANPGQQHQLALFHASSLHRPSQVSVELIIGGDAGWIYHLPVLAAGIPPRAGGFLCREGTFLPWDWTDVIDGDPFGRAGRAMTSSRTARS